MADERAMQQAVNTYNALCQAMDGRDWKYKRNDEKLIITSGAQGDDLPMDLFMKVDADRYLLVLLSRMPFEVPEDKRMELAVAITYINNHLVDGSFDFDLLNGRIYFRITSSYRDSALSADAFMYLIYCACGTIDDYNDKFMMMCKGMMSLEQFMQSEQQ